MAPNWIDAFPGTKIGHETYTIGKARITVRNYANDDICVGSPAGIDIRTIKVDKEFRRQGEARRAMVEITNWANAAQVVLYLWADPFDDQPMSEKKLRRFYVRFGFKGYRGRIMQRLPRPNKAPTHTEESET